MRETHETRLLLRLRSQESKGSKNRLVFGLFVPFAAFCKMDRCLRPVAAAKSLQIRLKLFLAGRAAAALHEITCHAVQLGPPAFGFAGMPLDAQGLLDLIERGFDHLVPGITRQVRPSRPGECPARPRPPASLFAARFVDAVGIMLEVHPRVAEEYAVGSFMNQPSHRRIGQRMLLEDVLVARQLRPQCAIEAQQ